MRGPGEGDKARPLDVPKRKGMEGGNKEKAVPSGGGGNDDCRARKMKTPEQNKKTPAREEAPESGLSSGI